MSTSEQDSRAADERSERARPRGWLRVRQFAVRLGILFLCLEVVLRIGVYLVQDQNPYYLFYGFQGAVSQAQVSPWSVYNGQYFKYPPNHDLQGAAGQKGERAHINSRGFRGPDFEPEKSLGTVRVVCMGGSSTFGFHDDDDETYPHYLQGLFTEQPASSPVEVINAGFPYYNTATIRGLLEEELVGYGPDVLTLYCGYNDASWPLEVSLFVRGESWLQQRSITFYLLKRTILSDKLVYKFLSLLPDLGMGRQDAATVHGETERIAQRFLANIERIAALAEQHDFEVVVVRQPITVSHQNPALKGLSYEEEFDDVRRRLESGAYLSEFDLRMLRQHRLVAELDDMARQMEWPVVDNIAITDRDRSRLSSWVHLTPEANLRLAEALRAAIQPLVEARR